MLLTNRRFHKHGEVWSWLSGQVENDESLEDAMIRQFHHEPPIESPQIIRRIGDVDLASGFRMTTSNVVIPEGMEPRIHDYEQVTTQPEWCAVLMRTLVTSGPCVSPARYGSYAHGESIRGLVKMLGTNDLIVGGYGDGGFGAAVTIGDRLHRLGTNFSHSIQLDTDQSYGTAASSAAYKTSSNVWGQVTAAAFH